MPAFFGKPANLVGGVLDRALHVRLFEHPAVRFPELVDRVPAAA
jgi:hypothetical protein